MSSWRPKVASAHPGDDFSAVTSAELMEPAASTYLYALSAISTTFVGFSALIMMVRQISGDGLSELEAWITRTFVQLGFFVTAGALTPPLLALCRFEDEVIWCLCSGIFGAAMLIFVLTYPARRRAVAGTSAPAFVYLDLSLLFGAVVLLISNAAGRPLAPNAGFYAAGLTGVLFVSGLGSLHALGHLRRDDSAHDR
jgi:hypothetical protein